MKRFFAMALAVVMIISMLPMSVFAATMSEQYANANFTVIADDQSTLAPGVTLNELVAYNKNNQRVEMYVTTVDMSVDTESEAVACILGQDPDQRFTGNKSPHRPSS